MPPIVNQDWLLEKYEGKTIDFQIGTGPGGQVQIVQGKIIRAGYQRPAEYGPQGQYIQQQVAQPLIEVNGKMQFQLPGTAAVSRGHRRTAAQAHAALANPI